MKRKNPLNLQPLDPEVPMTRRTSSHAAAIVALCGALCLALPAAVHAAPLRPAPATSDDELIAMGKSLPGFGGMFYDDAGYPTVYLRDPGHPAAVAALKSLGGEVRVLRGDFEFAQLVAWKLSLRSLLARPDVVYLDADEARNRVVIGIAPSADPLGKSLARASLDKDLAVRGVPKAAVIYKEAAPLKEMIGVEKVDGLPLDLLEAPPAKRAAPALNLVDSFRPAPGGVQITWIKLPYAYFCTLGFDAYLGSTFGFVTNSHCTADRDHVTGTRYSQGDYHTAAIATEFSDPAATDAPPCPTGRKCRYSDASFAKWDAATSGSLHAVARPTGKGTSAGSLVVRPSTLRFTINKTAPPALVGQTVNKVGRTTGWTSGKVLATCQDANVGGTTYTVLCQNFVQAGVGGGDSGSPVFTYSTGTAITLLGVLWGGTTDDLGHLIFAYSPLSAIQSELGALRVK
jgi:hypothetical protein